MGRSSRVALAALAMVPRARAQLSPAGASAATKPGACDITFADVFSKVSELDAACPDECTVECRAAALPFLDSCGALLDVLSIFDGDDDNSTRQRLPPAARQLPPHPTLRGGVLDDRMGMDLRDGRADARHRFGGLQRHARRGVDSHRGARDAGQGA